MCLHLIHQAAIAQRCPLAKVCSLNALQQNQGHKHQFYKCTGLGVGRRGHPLSLTIAHQIAGIIATNTTIRRDNLKTQFYANSVARLGNATDRKSPSRWDAWCPCLAPPKVITLGETNSEPSYPLLMGGIFATEDAWEDYRQCWPCQVYTGWICEGQRMVRRILRGLLHKLEEAVGHL